MTQPSTSYASGHSRHTAKRTAAMAFPQLPSRDYVPSQVDRSLLRDDRVLDNLLKTEDRHLPSSNYFKCVQSEVQPAMRRIVVQWMFEVTEEENCDPEVFPLAVSYLDRFLSIEAIHKKQLQHLGTACLFIASKLKQTQPISSVRLVSYTDSGVKMNELLSWELLVLGRLKWDTSGVTAHDFIDHLLHRLRLPPTAAHQIKDHVYWYIAIVALEFGLAILPPSMIACCCVCIALNTLFGQDVVQTAFVQRMAEMTLVEVDVLTQYCCEMEKFIRAYAREMTNNRGGLGAGALTLPSTWLPLADPTVTPTDVVDVSFRLAAA